MYIPGGPPAVQFSYRLFPLYTTNMGRTEPSAKPPHMTDVLSLEKLMTRPTLLAPLAHNFFHTRILCEVCRIKITDVLGWDTIQLWLQVFKALSNFCCRQLCTDRLHIRSCSCVVPCLFKKLFTQSSPGMLFLNLGFVKPIISRQFFTRSDYDFAQWLVPLFHGCDSFNYQNFIIYLKGDWPANAHNQQRPPLSWPQRRTYPSNSRRKWMFCVRWSSGKIFAVQDASSGSSSQHRPTSQVKNENNGRD